MRDVASGLVAASIGLLLAGCSAGGGVPSLFLPSSTLYVGPRGDAIVLLDHSPAVRTTQTVPGAARKVRLIVRDIPGHIVGGIIFSDIPNDNTITIPGLPAGTQLKFDATIADEQVVEVGRGKVKQELTANAANSIPIPIFMNSGELSAVNTSSEAQTTSSNRLNSRVTFAGGDHFRVIPGVEAFNALGNPVTCNPTYSILSGYETEDDHLLDTVNSGMFVVPTQAGTYDVQVDFSPNCPAGAVSIQRTLEYQKIATLSVAVD